MTLRDLIKGLSDEDLDKELIIQDGFKYFKVSVFSSMRNKMILFIEHIEDKNDNDS